MGKTVCLDFDGVVHENLRYQGTGIIKGALVPGALEGIRELQKDFTVVIHSARCSDPVGFDAVKKYVEDNGIPCEVVRDKPNAFVYVDDRALLFTGDWTAAAASVLDFKQWQTDKKNRARIMRKRVMRRR